MPLSRAVDLHTRRIDNHMTGFLSTPDGKTQAMGYCARRDKDGDTSSISWHQAAGADKGMWKSTGGTGKFANRTDSGWYQAAMADGAMSSTVWGGTCR